MFCWRYGPCKEGRKEGRTREGRREGGRKGIQIAKEKVKLPFIAEIIFYADIIVYTESTKEFTKMHQN